MAGTADLVIVVAKTDPTQRREGISLICVETDDARASAAAAISTRSASTAQDTARAVLRRCPGAAVESARRGRGHGLHPADAAVAAGAPDRRASARSRRSRRAVDVTVAYTKERKAFGKPIIEFQNTQFKLAEVQDEVDGRAGLPRPLHRQAPGRQTRRRRPRRWRSGG